MHAADAPPVHAEQATRADARDAVAAWDAMRARQRAHSARARQDGPTTPGTARQDATGPLSGQDGPDASPFPPDASELHPAGQHGPTLADCPDCPDVAGHLRAELRRAYLAERDRVILGDPDAPPVPLVGILADPTRSADARAEQDAPRDWYDPAAPWRAPCPLDPTGGPCRCGPGSVRCRAPHATDGPPTSTDAPPVPNRRPDPDGPALVADAGPALADRGALVDVAALRRTVRAALADAAARAATLPRRARPTLTRPRPLPDAGPDREAPPVPDQDGPTPDPLSGPRTGPRPLPGPDTPGGPSEDGTRRHARPDGPPRPDGPTGSGPAAPLAWIPPDWSVLWDVDRLPYAAPVGTDPHAAPGPLCWPWQRTTPAAVAAWRATRDAQDGPAQDGPDACAQDVHAPSCPDHGPTGPDPVPQDVADQVNARARACTCAERTPGEPPCPVRADGPTGGPCPDAQDGPATTGQDTPPAAPAQADQDGPTRTGPDCPTYGHPCAADCPDRTGHCAPGRGAPPAAPAQAPQDRPTRTGPPSCPVDGTPCAPDCEDGTGAPCPDVDTGQATRGPRILVGPGRLHAAPLGTAAPWDEPEPCPMAPYAPPGPDDATLGNPWTAIGTAAPGSLHLDPLPGHEADQADHEAPTPGPAHALTALTGRTASLTFPDLADAFRLIFGAPLADARRAHERQQAARRADLMRDLRTRARYRRTGRPLPPTLEP